MKCAIALLICLVSQIKRMQTLKYNEHGQFEDNLSNKSILYLWLEVNFAIVTISVTRR